MKYGRKKPINIKIFNSRGQAKFVITDQGVGIPRKDRKVLFKRFKRLDSTGENNQGLGVGLYIAKQIVTAHVGKIKVSSIPMRGTTFAIELPLNKAKVNTS
ncbi:HAMP domain-containing histidine kinase [Candidatus Roizmanbacteria bacterium]|nr:HAMP domain-containing histidine kinase [Candidatus Roizmanbacteria bacterium]